MEHYAFFGLGFYTALCAVKHETFRDADFVSLLRGFLIGCVFWPVGLVILINKAVR